MANTLIFEIGCEEIPSAALYNATKQVKTVAQEKLAVANLGYVDVETFSTPRRIVLQVKELEEKTQAQSLDFKGPAAKIAYDEDGNLTKAALGFAKSKGASADDLEVRADEKGTEYIYVHVEKESIDAISLLEKILPEIIKEISWPKAQRWHDYKETFSRPVRWLLAMHGDKVIEFEFANVQSSNKSQGHRLVANEVFELDHADNYFALCEKMFVVCDAQARANYIKDEVERLEGELGLKADLQKSTFAEVVNLVEYPTVLIGHFDEEFLDVPPEIITDAMLEHQRYFPMYNLDGSLSNAFIIVSNGAREYNDTIIDGNERVVRARLADAAFFVDCDLKISLDEFASRLSNVVFHKSLGSVGDKIARIKDNTNFICKNADVSDAESKDAQRGAAICKADLVSDAVVEFPSLQGIMGFHYANAAGEPADVAITIRDHYKPKFAGDTLPQCKSASIVALADKMDTIAGLFAADEAPTGSSDPYALRRGAIGIINICLDQIDVDLSALIYNALKNYEGKFEFDFNAVNKQIVEFFSGRLRVIAQDKGYDADIVAAVLDNGQIQPSACLDLIGEIQNLRKNDADNFENLTISYKRAANLTDLSLGEEVDKSLMGDAESALFDASIKAKEEIAKAQAKKDYKAVVDCLASLRGPIDTFFDEVMVMDEDESKKQNNLKLLNVFLSVFSDLANFSLIQ
ncbi:MAG: glycine--tRNA ligase subunit beta [Coriobacteriales bacterium]|nr:glycine--tRNA ligase subunit beta [Coriobacteriales bacterium]